jgi:uncharacterized protein (DUF58 family)
MNAAAQTVLRPPNELARGDFEMVVRRLADDLAFGADASLFVGSGLEYASSRPYIQGDSIRMLNWRLTARTGKPFVKEHEALKRTTVYIVLDTSASMAVASTPLDKHSLAIWIAAAVGLVAQRRLSPVGVIGGGERETRLTPSLLGNDLWHALEPLRQGSLDEGTRLADRITRLDAHADRSSVILVLSDLHDPHVLTALRHASQKHDCAAIHLIDPAEAGQLRAGIFRGQEAETGRGFLGHGGAAWGREGEVRSELARCGVSYLRLLTDRSIIAPLRYFLASRASVLRGRG